jgi:hypothetical protein
MDTHFHPWFTSRSFLGFQWVLGCFVCGLVPCRGDTDRGTVSLQLFHLRTYVLATMYKRCGSPVAKHLPDLETRPNCMPPHRQNVPRLSRHPKS